MRKHHIRYISIPLNHFIKKRHKINIQNGRHFDAISMLKPVNGLENHHGLPNIGHKKHQVNNGRQTAISNLIKLIYFMLHPPLKPHILFHSNGLAI